MENFEKTDEESLEKILKDLENSKKVKDMIINSRRAAVWVSRINPGVTLLGPEVSKIFNAKNLDKSEFMNAFISELIYQRRKAKTDKISCTEIKTDKLSKFAIPGHPKTKLEKG